MRATSILVLLALSYSFSVADVIECDNGDRYNGKVLSMDEKIVKLRNEITGVLSIPRHRIVSISFRDAAKAPLAVKSATNSPSIAPGKPLHFDPAAVQQVQNELLSTANPEANQLFQEMLSGLQSGQLNLGDIRAKAETSLQELREAQKELGDDDLAGILDSYGAILENFIRQAPPRAGASALNPAPSGPRSSPAQE